jgi:hypothetical protein
VFFTKYIGEESEDKWLSESYFNNLTRIYTELAGPYPKMELLSLPGVTGRFLRKNRGAIRDALNSFLADDSEIFLNLWGPKLSCGEYALRCF